MGLRLWHGVEFSGNAVRGAFPRRTPAWRRCRKRLRNPDCGDGYRRPRPVARVGFGITLVWLANRHAVAPDGLFPDWIRDLVVRRRSSGIADVFRNCGLPELCK